MQALLQIVESITGTVTRGIWIVVVGGIAIMAIISLTFAIAAPAIVEDVGERAERISDKAIEAAREESRAHQLAKEGWGYSDTADAPSDTADAYSDTGADHYDDSYGEYDPSWGEPTE